MKPIGQGDIVRIRDEIEHKDSCSWVLAAIDDLILTFDPDESLIERFGADWWNASSTRHIVGKVQ